MAQTITPTSAITTTETSGFWQKAQKDILGLLDFGEKIYGKVSGRTIAGEKIKKETVTPTKTKIDVLGTSVNTTTVVLGGVAVLALIVILAARK